MPRRYLSITDVPVLGGCVVRPKGDPCAIGAFYPKGDVFKRSPVFKPLDNAEWTSSCLRELAGEVDKRYPKRPRRKRQDTGSASEKGET